MKYYAAATSTTDVDAAIVIPPFNVLLSYHYWKKKKDQVKAYVDAKIDVFIDSGAFSAKTKGVEIDIDEYCVFLKDTGVITYAGLDVIGNAKRTRENNEYMVKQGLNPIPTFHVGSSLDDLAKLMGYSYIALGGLVWTEGIRSHLNKVWHYILTHNPGLRVHGFGTTNLELMAAYPWYSVDSSSYMWCKRFGDQYILQNDFELEKIREEQYLELLERSGYKDVRNYTKAERYFLYDFHSCQSYKMYAAHLTVLNRYRKFDNLIAQNSLF